MVEYSQSVRKMSNDRKKIALTAGRDPGCRSFVKCKGRTKTMKAADKMIAMII